MAVYEEGFAPSSDESRSGIYLNYAGAALSLALIAGVGFWGYKLIMRDVSGIPVVRAMEGDMRVLPDNPGGSVAAHTGLAVNEVAAVGEAGGPEDRLVLAPATPGLTVEDLEAQPTAEADEVVPTETATIAPAMATDTDIAADTAPLTTDQVLALADQIADGVEPVLTPAAPVADLIPASVPGVAVSLRPAPRPASLRPTPVAAAVAEAAPTPAPAAQEMAISTEAFAPGTSLVQLGAFRTPELANDEWTRLQSRFGQLMGDHARVIQVSTQSNGTWYRLRASGFADRAEAKRFCAALEAEGAGCIAVVVN
ncbi:SPOR domain-containing protein [Yoonia sp. SS1-5]|uniref:SPOR domain-containing protein n=1 Tax=Yoonia rhodophyticola TaxID=3137370 RepID=A0AAN0MJ44_9RHOB